MPTEYLGHRLCNVLAPGDPKSFNICTLSGTWSFHRCEGYQEAKDAILSSGACAITYDVFTEVITAGSRAAAIDARHSELLPICLAASYLVGMSVRPVQDLPGSAVKFISVGDHFPRERAMITHLSLVTTLTDFTSNIERFVAQYPVVEEVEKIRLLIHHWLDAMAFWSMEDLTLSTATILEIIAATAQDLAKRSGKNLSTFNTRINYAADRFGLPHLNSGFRRMRNDLVHEGSLSGRRLQKMDKESCSALISESLNWIDQYICAVFGFPSGQRERYDRHTFRTVNAFSLD